MLIDSIENKQKILHHFLELCVLEGWSEDSLRQAFVKAEIDVKFQPFIFENGCADVADFFVRQIDEEVQKISASIDFNQIKIRDKIKTLVKIRLKINQQYQAQIRCLIAFYLKPKHIRLAIKNSYKTADLMWNLAGDNTSNFNFYSKRLILAKIYIRVLMCFAKDDSENYQTTLDLLDREIEKVMQFAAFKFKVKKNFTKAGDALQKVSQIKNDFFQNPKNFIKKLPFIRLYK